MRILFYFLFITFIYSCNGQLSEAEKILDEWMINDLEILIIQNKHKPAIEKMEDSTLQYFETFILEMKENDDFDQSVENIIKGTGNNDFSRLHSKEISKIQKKKEIFDVLKIFYVDKYACIFSLPEVALVNKDTIYLPRNRTFFKNKILYDRFSNSTTLARSSFYRNLSLNIDTISTFTQKDHITHTSEIKVKIPYRAKYRSYQSEFTISVFDPKN